ncbi:MAG TPA: NAD(P)H-binding protein [Nocardioidaceae bacterium]|nr:NAD(P)H-binding protein [Nocardioidaceae bacterium]
MRVFVAGGTGVVGRRLVPQLVARGHQVTATTTSPGRLGLLEELGADAVVMDGLDAVSVGEAVAKSKPDAIVHQMTAISVAHAGKPDMKHIERWFATTIRRAPRGRTTCWPRPRRPAYPMSSRRVTPAGTESARADG